MTGVLPSVFEELEQAVILFAEEGEPYDCNTATETLLGYSQSEIRQASLVSLITPGADLNEVQVQEYIASVTDGGSKTFEWQVRRANGEPRWTETTISPIGLDGTHYVLAEIEDLTAYKARGRRLQLLYRILRHNLRNDMNVISGYAEELETAIENENLKQQIAIIRETAEDIGKLSESVADLERLVEKDATERSQTNVAKVVQRVVSELQEKHPDATIEVTVEEETAVSADEGLPLALEHTIINAVEHNDADNPKVTITQDATDREAIIRVTDNGPGIPEMEIEALETGQTDLEHGSSLGLSLTKWCTQSLGGHVNIETSPTEGTTLTIYLPRLKE